MTRPELCNNAWLGYYRSDSVQVRVKTLNGFVGTIEEHRLTMAVLRELGEKAHRGDAFGTECGTNQGSVEMTAARG